MRIKSDAKKVRLNLDMSEATRQRLESLLSRTGADSRSEVIRRALAVYDFACAAKERGESVVLRGPGGREKELLLL
jgi:metal-responsive CopG/Arc/MetJ family transcriptional regulator